MNTVDILRKEFQKINEANENEEEIRKIQARWRVWDNLHCVKAGQLLENFCSECQGEWEEVQ